jgi:hypothetical protein
METSYDNIKLEEKFNIIKKIGQGSFGEVYLTKYLEACFSLVLAAH